VVVEGEASAEKGAGEGAEGAGRGHAGGGCGAVRIGGGQWRWRGREAEDGGKTLSGWAHCSVGPLVQLANHISGNLQLGILLFALLHFKLFALERGFYAPGHQCSCHVWVSDWLVFTLISVPKWIFNEYY
jgi:hypothetical protein